MILIKPPGADCHTATAATGSMYAASSWPRSSASTSAVLEVNWTGSKVARCRSAWK